jgi:hypothetical protein
MFYSLMTRWREMETQGGKADIDGISSSRQITRKARGLANHRHFPKRVCATRSREILNWPFASGPNP